MPLFNIPYLDNLYIYFKNKYPKEIDGTISQSQWKSFCSFIVCLLTVVINMEWTALQFITLKVQIWMLWIQMYKRDKITDSFEWQLHIKPHGGLTGNEYRY